MAASSTNWNSPVWDQIYGQGAGAQPPAPAPHPAAAPAVPSYIAVLQQAAAQNIPQYAITMPGVDAAALSSSD